MQQQEPSDAALVNQTLTGNREAFGQLYDRYARLVRAVAASVSGEQSATPDLTQESFLRAYRKLATLREPDRFGFWVAGIARQVARERRRRLRRDRHEFVGDRPLEVASPTDEFGELEASEQIDVIHRALVQLDEREQLAIHAFFLEGRDARQAGELLGLSRSGAYALVARAVARLTSLVCPRAAENETR